eukprot:ANDGO_07960.mRNA.1 putative choline kinase 3
MNSTEREEFVADFVSKTGFGPRIYSLFDDPVLGKGRIEEFWQAHRSLSVVELSRFRRSIARLMGLFHRECAPLLSSWSSKCSLPRSSSDGGNCSGGNGSAGLRDHSFHFLYRWVDLARNHPEASKWDWRDIDAFLNDHVAEVRSLDCTVMCHSDIQELNLLVPDVHAEAADDSVDHPDPASVRLIDYEYAQPAHPALDIANYFVECCIDNISQRVDRRSYPCVEERYQFYVEYLKHSPDHVAQRYTELDELDAVVHVCCGVSHLQWASWAIVKGYLQYAENRLSWFRDHLADHPFSPIQTQL